jgi:hypothetical protein
VVEICNTALDADNTDAETRGQDREATDAAVGTLSALPVYPCRLAGREIADREQAICEQIETFTFAFRVDRGAHRSPSDDRTLDLFAERVGQMPDERDKRRKKV